MRISTITLLIGMCISGSSVNAAPGPKKISFQSGEGIEAHGYLFKPGNDGPYPVVIGLHGCAGLFWNMQRTRLLQTQNDWMRILTSAGYAVFFPDSYGTRGYRSLCHLKTQRYPVKFHHQVSDLIGATNLLRELPDIDNSKIALIGWGSGGTAALRITAPEFADQNISNIKTSIAFYPYCKWLESSTDYSPRIQPTILIGALDTLTPPGPCKALANKWGSPITLFNGTYHGFDNPNRRVHKYMYGNIRALAGTNIAARRKAITTVMQILEKNLKQAE